MKKRYYTQFAAIILVVCAVFSVGVSAQEAELEITSQAAILVDMKSELVLYGKNETERMYPASTTKIMVALLTLENLELDEVVTAHNSALSLLLPGHTNIGIKNGEQLTVEQLLYGLMLASAGDAADVLGERISGSVDEFVVLMNEKARELGMKNTQYQNASGAHDENHYTTATDLAILAKEAMKNEVFRKIVATDGYEIPATEKYNAIRFLRNTNHLVSKKRTDNYFYEYATGIKTGYTDPAGNCLVSSAEKDGMSLICVVLGASPAEDGTMMQFVESKALFEYGFANFEKLSEKEEEEAAEVWNPVEEGSDETDRPNETKEENNSDTKGKTVRENLIESMQTVAAWILGIIVLLLLRVG